MSLSQAALANAIGVHAQYGSALRELGVRFAQGYILGKPAAPGRGGMVY